MIFNRVCLVCGENLDSGKRIEAKTCGSTCRSMLNRRYKRHEGWQDSLSSKASKCLDDLMVTCSYRTVEPDDMFERVMHLGNMHGGKVASQYLEVIADVFKIYAIF